MSPALSPQEKRYHKTLIIPLEPDHDYSRLSPLPALFSSPQPGDPAVLNVCSTDAQMPIFSGKQGARLEGLPRQGGHLGSRKVTL